MAYVYRHIRLDKNEPFYIGICKNDDPYFKRAGSNTRNNIWKKIVAKTDFEVEILFSNVDLEFAKKKEIEFISLYGRICCGNGTLANIGGGGEPMFNPPEYLRNRLSERVKGEGNPFYGKTHTEETRKKISENQKGKKKKPLSEEAKKKISLAHKGKPTWIKGVKQPQAALKRSGVNHRTYKGEILCYDREGNFVKEFLTTREAAEYFGYPNSSDSISRVIKGNSVKYWHGYSFRLKNET